MVINHLVEPPYFLALVGDCGLDDPDISLEARKLGYGLFDDLPIVLLKSRHAFNQALQLVIDLQEDFEMILLHAASILPY